MKIKRASELQIFLSTCFLDSDPDDDDQTTHTFVSTCSSERRQRILDQGKRLLADPEFPIDEIGAEANRWFSSAEEGRAWLQNIMEAFEENQAPETAVVKDSNGTLLSEGDSVQVIKDLKVKGGSSDLKRGTTIKKIHLIDDPEAIECRVDGSVLVLKTCFLKKV